jgi:S-adenosylmethionine:tRNA ribosyltransferase-isomerase
MPPLFTLPPELIAQTGLEPRDSSRLMVLHPNNTLEHRIFRDVTDYLQAGDVLVFNESKVIPARLEARKPTGGKIEVLLLREFSPLEWSAYLKPARKASETLIFGEGQATATIVGTLEDGARMLRFDRDIKPLLDELGSLPLPPYIQHDASDPSTLERYQTVYAKAKGSVAAPTAGLHFTPELLEKVRERGIETHFLTLHVGAGTFKPIKGRLEDHQMHQEVFDIPVSTARATERAKLEGRRIIAVGTTTVRALESAWNGTSLEAGAGETAIFIHPPYTFGVIDALITNFHLPDSTLILLVSALAGTDRIANAYDTALLERYRFYSLGDAMLIL